MNITLKLSEFNLTLEEIIMNRHRAKITCWCPDNCC